METKIHLILTGLRLGLLTLGLSVFGTFALLSLFAGNPLAVITNLVLWDLVAGRFMQVEHQLAMRDVTIDFPGKQLAHHIVAIYSKRVHPKRAAKMAAELDEIAA